MAILLRQQDLPPQAWKNGGGVTRQIAIDPPGASLTDFDWRISMATVAANGAFSDFSGVDRTLAILTGQGMALQLNDGPLHTLCPGEPPLCFAGEDQVWASLLSGPVVDFNIMTRRGRYTHQLQQQLFSQPVQQTPALLWFLAAGESLLCQRGEEQYALKPFDSLLLSDADLSPWRLTPCGAVRLFSVTLRAVPSSYPL